MQANADIVPILSNPPNAAIPSARARDLVWNETLEMSNIVKRVGKILQL